MTLYTKKFLAIVLGLSLSTTVMAEPLTTASRMFYSAGTFATGAALHLACSPKLTNGYRILKGILGAVTLQNAAADIWSMNTEDSDFVNKISIFFAMMKSFVGISFLINSIFSKKEKEEPQEARMLTQEEVNARIDATLKDKNFRARRYTGYTGKFNYQDKQLEQQKEQVEKPA